MTASKPPPIPTSPAEAASEPALDRGWEDLDITELQGLTPPEVPLPLAQSHFSVHDAPTVPQIRVVPSRDGTDHVITVVHLEITVSAQLLTCDYGRILDAIKSAALDAGAVSIVAMRIIDVESLPLNNQR